MGWAKGKVEEDSEGGGRIGEEMGGVIWGVA